MRFAVFATMRKKETFQGSIQNCDSMVSTTAMSAQPQANQPALTKSVQFKRSDLWYAISRHGNDGMLPAERRCRATRASSLTSASTAKRPELSQDLELDKNINQWPTPVSKMK